MLQQMGIGDKQGGRLTGVIEKSGALHAKGVEVRE